MYLVRAIIWKIGFFVYPFVIFLIHFFSALWFQSLHMFSNYDSVSEMLVGFNKSSASSNYEVSLEEGISVSTLFSLILALPGTRVHVRYSIHFSLLLSVILQWPSPQPGQVYWNDPKIWGDYWGTNQCQWYIS